VIQLLYLHLPSFLRAVTPHKKHHATDIFLLPR
jgi:hypothetical protein